MTDSALIQEYAILQEAVQPHLDRMAEIEEEFRNREIGTYHSDFGSVRVSINHRFNANKAMDLLSTRSLRRVMVPTIKASLVKENFPGIYRRSRDQFSNKVSVNAAQIADLSADLGQAV